LEREDLDHSQQKEELDWTYSERQRTIEGCYRGKNGGEENTRKKKNRYARRAIIGGHIRTDEEKSGGQSWLAKLDTMDLPDGRALMMMMIFGMRSSMIGLSYRFPKTSCY